MWPLGNSVLILSEKNLNKLVAVYRPEDQAKLCLPGGKQEKNEGSVEGAIREVFEETGITLHENQLIPLYSNFCTSQNITYWVTTYITFISEKTHFAPLEDNLHPHWIETDVFLKSSYYTEYYNEVFTQATSFLKEQRIK